LSQRSCLPCTACCSGCLLVEDINGINLSRGNSCEHLTSKGCRIRENRPDNPCREFNCRWITDETLPEEFRPDKSGAIIIQGKHNYMNNPIDEVVPIGNRIPENTLDKLEGFYGNTPFVYSYIVQGEPKLGLYGDPTFKKIFKAVVEKVTNGYR